MNDGEQDYSDIDRWHDQYAPQEGYLPGPEALPEGSYDFVIDSATLTKTNDGGTVFKLNLMVQSGPYHGLRLQRPTFFDRQQSVDYLGGDMITLGMGPNWGNRDVKPLSRWIADTIPMLKGVRFVGVRKNGKARNPGETGFPNLSINARIAAPGAMPPPAMLGGKHTSSHIPAGGHLPGSQHPANQFAHHGAAVGNDDDIPF